MSAITDFEVETDGEVEGDSAKRRFSSESTKEDDAKEIQKKENARVLVPTGPREAVLNFDQVLANSMKEFNLDKGRGTADAKEEDTKALAVTSTYQIRPSLEEKFKALTVKEMIHSVLNDELGGKVYNEEEAEVWSKVIANTIRNKVREMGFKRYKFLVQSVIGEQHGAGVKIGSRCLWDADTDNYASDVFLNDTIFCMVVVFAIYFY